MVLEVAKPVQREGGSVAVNISICLSLYPDPGITTDGLLGAADRELKSPSESGSLPFSCRNRRELALDLFNEI